MQALHLINYGIELVRINPWYVFSLLCKNEPTENWLNHASLNPKTELKTLEVFSNPWLRHMPHIKFYYRSRQTQISTQILNFVFQNYNYSIYKTFTRIFLFNFNFAHWINSQEHLQPLALFFYTQTQN